MGVLVTGGAGFIGSHMVLELLDAGEDVVVLDNLSTGFRWAVPDQAEFVEGDVGDQSLVRRLLSGNRIDAIIHFAGSVVVPEFGRRSARLLSQQHLQVALADRLGGRRQGPAFHLLIERGGLWHAEGESGCRDGATPADVALRHLEADDRADAARHG